MSTYHVADCTAEVFDAFVHTHPNGLIFQTARYNKAMLTNGFTEWDYVAVADESGMLVGGLAFYMKPLPKPFQFFYYAVSKHAFTVNYENRELFTFLFEAVRKKMKQLGVVLFTFDLPVDENNKDFYRYVESLGCETRVFSDDNSNNIIFRHNSFLDLSGSIAEILKRMKGNSRRAVNKALDFDYELEIGGMDRFDEFYDLLEVSADRAGFVNDNRESLRHKVAGILEIPGSELWFVRLHGEKTAAYFRKERDKALKVIAREEKKKNPNENRLREERSFVASQEERIAEMEELAREYPEGRVLAACLIGEAGQKITYMYSGSLDEYRHYFPVYFEIYKMIERSKERGYEVLDLSGTESDEEAQGLGNFKLGLGGKTVSFSGNITCVIKKPWGNLFKALLKKRRQKQFAG